MKNLFYYLIAFLISFTLVSCSQGGGEATTGEAAGLENTRPLGQASVVDDASAKNILQVAIGSADHTTLVAAVQAAQIEHILVNGSFNRFRSK